LRLGVETEPLGAVARPVPAHRAVAQPGQHVAAFGRQRDDPGRCRHLGAPDLLAVAEEAHEVVGAERYADSAAPGGAAVGANDDAARQLARFQFDLGIAEARALAVAPVADGDAA